VGSKLRFVPQVQEHHPSEGFTFSVVALVASLLALEKFCFGDPDGVSANERIWLNDDEREVWFGRLRSIVHKSKSQNSVEESSVDDIVGSLRKSLLDLVDAMLERGPLAGGDSVARQRLLFEHWRWTRFTENANSLADVAVAVSHIERFFPDKLKTAAANSWKRAKKAELL